MQYTGLPQISSRHGCKLPTRWRPALQYIVNREQQSLSLATGCLMPAAGILEQHHPLPAQNDLGTIPELLVNSPISQNNVTQVCKVLRSMGALDHDMRAGRRINISEIDEESQGLEIQRVVVE